MRTTVGGILLLGLGSALAAGCGDEPLGSAEGPPPVAGGTLLVTDDGRWAIASDPDRASIHVVDLERREALHRIELTAADEPGRGVEGADGRVHVVLRRSGEVLTLDPASGEVRERRAVCAAPRGIDVEPDTGGLVVACAEGLLVRLPASGGDRSVTTLEPDLRDVIALSGDRFFLSRFQSAELLLVEGGAIVERMRPPIAESIGFGSATQVPTVAWRTRAHPDGAIMVHQLSTSTQLGTLSVPSGQYYGGDCVTGVVRSAVTVFDAATGPRSAGISGASLVVDLVADESELHFAAASEPGNLLPLNGVRTMRSSMLAGSPACNTAIDPYPLSPSAAIAVALTPSGARVAQYRDPALLRVDGGMGVVDIPLPGGRVEHLGYSLFHEAAGSGATCASCHPEGGDDGHTWLFDIGARRTQTLRGGILQTAPFHWDGEVADVGAVMQGTFVGRMGGEMPRDYELESFGAWMDALPALPAPRIDAGSVDRGRAAFEGAGCADCHTGDRGTNNATTDVGTGGEFQVPALEELAYRAPYLHDGSAGSLADVILTHGRGGTLSDGERTDLEAYLRSR